MTRRRREGVAFLFFFFFFSHKQWLEKCSTFNWRRQTSKIYFKVCLIFFFLDFSEVSHLVLSHLWNCFAHAGSLINCCLHTCSVQKPQTSDLLRLLAGIQFFWGLKWISQHLLLLWTSNRQLKKLKTEKRWRIATVKMGRILFPLFYFVEKWRCKCKTIYVKLFKRMFEISDHI